MLLYLIMRNDNKATVLRREDFKVKFQVCNVIEKSFCIIQIGRKFFDPRS